MKFTALSLPGVVLVEPKLFTDERGFFFEAYHQQRFADHGIPEVFVQDNHSRSGRGVVRGLHFQKTPRAQGKLVRALTGAIFDVAVDIRPESPFFGRWVGETLSAENHCMLYVPPGFAHGFCALEDNSEVHYKTTDFYSPEHDAGLLWNDPEIGVRWPELDVPYRLSDKDLKNPPLRQLK